MNKSVQFRSYSAHHVYLLAWCLFLYLPWLLTMERTILLKTPIRILLHLWCDVAPSRTLEVLRPVASSAWPHPWTSPQWRWDVPQTCGKLMAWHPIHDYPRMNVPPTEPRCLVLLRRLRTQPYLLLLLLQYWSVGDLFIQLSSLKFLNKPVGDLFIQKTEDRRRTNRRREGLHYHHGLTNVQPWLSLYLCTNVQRLVCWDFVYFIHSLRWINQFDSDLTQHTMSTY